MNRRPYHILGLLFIVVCIGTTWMLDVENSGADEQLPRFPTRSNGPESKRLFEAALISSYSGIPAGNHSLQHNDAFSPPPQQLLNRDQIITPKAIEGNTGKFMSPYTSDKVLAEWTDKMIKVKLGSSVGSVAGSTVGTIVGQEALKQVPFVGGMLGGMFGKVVGESVGKSMTLQAGGGWETIKKTSDISFNSLDDLAVYLYVNNSDHEHFQHALEALTILYPEFAGRYQQAVVNAPLKRYEK